MIRTQIQLKEAQAQALKALAVDQDLSVSELIRQSVDDLLGSTGDIDREERKRRAIAAAGRYSSGLSDLSTDHDRYLSESYNR